MESMVEHMEDSTITNLKQHKLYDNWTMWAHLPHDTDWSLSSYKNIITLETIEEALAFFEGFPEVMTKNCMLFLMRNGIQPIWEDEKNKKGGCFSYKINNRNVAYSWKNLSYVLLGETLTTPELSKHINGITISPKKNFCIIKIWFENCNYNNPDIITEIDGLSKHGCLFKKHISE
jgi:translation initiation factor 4E